MISDRVSVLRRDISYGARLLKKRPGFTSVAAATLALGIGATTAIFSIVDAVVLRPLPYKDPDKLVQVLSAQIPRTGPSKLFNSYSDVQYWQSHSQSFERLEAYTWIRASQTIILNGRAEKALAIPTSAGFFSLLGVAAAEGRTFEPGDLNNGAAVVLSYGFWKGRLGGRTDVVGTSLMLGGEPATVLGIMPESFNFYPKQAEMWTLIRPDGPFAKDPLNSLVIAYGRLKPNVTRESAQAELALLHRQVVDHQKPDSWISHVEPAVDFLQEDLTWLAGRNLRTGLLVLLGAVGLVLLIACVNVANLLLGRSVDRQREFAIRAALGSSRSRVIGQLLTESVLLSALGAAPGILLAVAAVDYFRATSPIELPPGNPLAVNARVLVFAVALTIGTGLLFGLAPALRISKLNLYDVLKATSRSATGGALGHRIGRLLVVGEVTLAIVLLTGAGLLIQSMLRLASSPLGFRSDHLLTARIELPATSYPDINRRAQYYDALVSRLAGIAGVEDVALTSSLPLSGPGNRALSVEGRPDAPNGGIGDVGIEIVSAAYFGVMNIPVLRGREFDSRDRAEAQPVALISEDLAASYFPGEDPIGKHIKLADPDPRTPWLTIVGVVGDIKRTTVYKEMEYVTGPFVFQPVAQAAPASVGILARTSGNPFALASALEREIAALNSEVPVSDVRTMDDRITEFLASARFRAQLLGLFAALALVLAAIGIYGVLSQAVSQRRQEIGIRVALGAQPRDVLRLVVRQGMLPAIEGIAIGVAASLALSRSLSSLLYGVSASDPATLGMNVILLGCAAMLACYIPARRATRVDPMDALRDE